MPSKTPDRRTYLPHSLLRHLPRSRCPKATSKAKATGARPIFRVFAVAFPFFRRGTERVVIWLFLIFWCCFWITRVRKTAIEEWGVGGLAWMGFVEAWMPELKRPWMAWSVPSQARPSTSQSFSQALILASPSILLNPKCRSAHSAASLKTTAAF